MAQRSALTLDVGLDIAGAGSIAKAQTITLTTINGIAVPPDEVFVSEDLFPDFDVEWVASANALSERFHRRRLIHMRRVPDDNYTSPWGKVVDAGEADLIVNAADS